MIRFKIVLTGIIGTLLLASCGNTADSAQVDGMTDSISEEESIIDNTVEESGAYDDELEDNTSEETDLIFGAYDIYGNEVNSDDFADANLIMLNFWEPWCGPCIGEMPELEQLYEKYKDDGFVIIGAYVSEGMDDQIIKVIEDAGITYPIINATPEMYQYMTEYVPTTVFFDGAWHALTDEPYIGANSYEAWDEIINSYL